MSGTLAFCWAELSVTMAPIAGGAPMLRAGPVLTILEKREDAWRVLRDANMLA